MMRIVREWRQGLRAPSDKEAGQTLRCALENEHRQTQPEKDTRVLCRQCYSVITNVAEQIERQGGHEHHFANPDGIVFHIGCFRNACGCGSIGTATEEWSWFQGYAWKVALCRQCLTHIGWMYLSTTSAESFYGLILGQLIFPHGWS
jgi:hypothetical protein